VLAQIILELDAEKIDMFPVALLMRLIRVNDRLVQLLSENREVEDTPEAVTTMVEATFRRFSLFFKLRTS